MTTMSGASLGDILAERRWVPPPDMPRDPLASDAAMGRWLEVWAEWATAMHLVIATWAGDIDELVELKAVTCAELKEYNDSAIQLWRREAWMARKLILAGGDPDRIPMPPTPALFASNVKVFGASVGGTTVYPQELPDIRYTLPCLRSSRYPNFSELAVFGKKEQIAAAYTPSGGQLAVAFPIWAWIVLAAIGSGTLIVSLQLLRGMFTDDDIAETNQEMFRQVGEQNSLRVEMHSRCIRESLAAIGREPTATEHSEIRDRCAGWALKIVPPVKPPYASTSVGWGTYLLLGGLGIAAVIGSAAYFKGKKADQ